MLTLITDWQNQDHYLAVLKARFLSEQPDLNIISLSHNILKFNKLEAALILRNVLDYFPENTIHLISVASVVDAEHKPIIVKAAGQYFISADNGILHYALNDFPNEFYSLNEFSETSFPALTIFAPIALHLLQKKSLNLIAKKTINYQHLTPFLPFYDEYQITGQVLYIDSFGNAITNISKALFDEISAGREFAILPGTGYYKIRQIFAGYWHVEGGEMLALFNSQNLLELAINQGNITELINLEINSTIKIQFS